jgi:hypothetical protein
MRYLCDTASMLPTYRFSACAACGQQDQGTRAKAGNSVRCVGCKIMRRVPASRPEHGPDDPRAVLPARGRPLEPGNPHRFTTGGVRPEVAAQRRSAPRATTAPARAAAVPQSRPVAVPAAAVAELEEYPPFVPCRACERCEIEDYRDPETGEYPPAVVRVQMWHNGESIGDEYQCIHDFEHYREYCANNPEWRIGIIELPRTEDIRETYVNPDTCPHKRPEYDPMYEVTRCLDCSAVKPGFGMPNGWRP